MTPGKQDDRRAENDRLSDEILAALDQSLALVKRGDMRSAEVVLDRLVQELDKIAKRREAE